MAKVLLEMKRVIRVRSAIDNERFVVTSVLFTAILLLLYALPTCLELLMVRYLSFQAAYGLVGDLAGYLGLFTFGFKRLALVVYVLSKLLEAGFFKGHFIQIDDLLWLTDLIPTVVCTGLLCKRIFLDKVPLSI